MAFLASLILSEGKGTTISTTPAGSGDAWKTLTDTWENNTDTWVSGSLEDTFSYNDKTMFYVNNGSIFSIDVTIAAVQKNNFLPGTGNLTKNNIVASVAPGTTAILDCRAISYKGTDGLVSISYSDNTDTGVVPLQIDRV